MGILVEENKYRLKLLKLLRSDITKARFPKIIVLQTLNRCNCYCSMCPYSYTVANEERTLMSESLFQKILEELGQEKEFETMIMAFQNEPLMDDRTRAFAKMFKDKLPRRSLEMVTNGSLLNENIINDIYKYFDIVHISLNAFSKETHKAVTNTEHYDKVVSNLEAIYERGFSEKTILRFIRQKSNFKERADFKKYWNKKGFKVFGFDVNNRLSEVKNFNEKIKVPAFKKDLIKMKALKYLGKMILPTCHIPFLVFYIKANGDVVQCFNDWSNKHILGNVEHTSIKSIFNSQQYTDIRKLLIQNKLNENIICEKCDLYKEGIWLTA